MQSKICVVTTKNFSKWQKESARKLKTVFVRKQLMLRMKPLELSWKSKKLPLVMTKREPPARTTRDPRFDPLCGEFDKKIFSRNYNFVQKLKMDDKASLTKELRETNDPERKKIIKLLIKRLVNFCPTLYTNLGEGLT